MIDIIYLLIEYVDPNDVLKISKIDKRMADYCTAHPMIISELMLKKFGVDYKDRGNLIYMDKNFDDYCCTKNGIIIYDLNKIYLLYLQLFNADAVWCEDKNITTIPPLPNLRFLYCDRNAIVSFPELPKLLVLGCTENLLEVLPTISSLESLTCSTNSPTSSPTSPRLRRLDHRLNEITTLPDPLNLDEDIDYYSEPEQEFPNLIELNYSFNPISPETLFSRND